MRNKSLANSARFSRRRVAAVKPKYCWVVSSGWYHSAPKPVWVPSSAVNSSSHLLLVNLGPGFDNGTRTALHSADHVVIPLPPDRQSLHMLSNIKDAFGTFPEPVRVLGNILLLCSVRLDQPVSVQLYNEIQVAMSGPDWFGTIREYPGLLSLSHEARKPTFHLKPGDGAMASLLKAAQDTGKEYRTLALTLASRARLSLPIEPSPPSISS